ncbi:hypothetical protein COCNU_10G003830 [Cocos nucifera]|uniref:T-complex protein 1 subunit alpha n=1 Tax=Cocos nucifera TaxID=13894 RepID=A0A8K0IM31_COCNU|nr:hypothetical protein COCNU_10G003830 [Cocos nucifera]
MAIAAQSPDILGERQSGQDVRTQNVVACQAVANIVKSSLGPVGLDKMLVDDIGDVTITNDGATILKMLEVEHPAAKVLVELAELQDREVGDGTTSVVIVAAELLKRANDLVRNKIHPTSIISGYRLAMREACKYVEEKLAVKVEKLGKDSLINCAKTSMSSKLIGSDSDFFANLVVDAVQAVKTTNARGEVRYPIKGINILKAHGKSAKDSYLLNGYALNTGRAAQGMPTRVAPARIACLDFNLQKTKMQMGVQVLVTDPRELEKIREREADITKERIDKILKAGANVVLTTKGIDDMALKACFSLYFVEAGTIAVRRVRKEDLRHVAKATGATAVSTFADMEGEETFDSSFLGFADEVVEERIADDDVILVKGTKNTSAVSLILRGANDYMLDEMDRSLHDAMCIVKRTLESNMVHLEAKRFRTSTYPKYEELIIIFEDTTTTGKEMMASTQDVSDSGDSQENELHLDDVIVDEESSGSRNHRQPRDPIPTKCVHCVRSQSRVLELADAIRSLAETNQARNNMMIQQHTAATLSSRQYSIANCIKVLESIE